MQKDINHCTVLQSKMRKLVENKLALKGELKTLQDGKNRSGKHIQATSPRN